MWSSDFQLPDGEWFGDWLHAVIAENALLEQHGFMPERARAAASRLQSHRAADERFAVEVPWLDEFTALPRLVASSIFRAAYLNAVPTKTLPRS
jgi:hypothetical protein